MSKVDKNLKMSFSTSENNARIGTLGNRCKKKFLLLDDMSVS